MASCTNTKQLKHSFGQRHFFENWFHFSKWMPVTYIQHGKAYEGQISWNSFAWFSQLVGTFGLLAVLHAICCCALGLCWFSSRSAFTLLQFANTEISFSHYIYGLNVPPIGGRNIMFAFLMKRHFDDRLRFAMIGGDHQSTIKGQKGCLANLLLVADTHGSWFW